MLFILFLSTSVVCSRSEYLCTHSEKLHIGIVVSMSFVEPT